MITQSYIKRCGWTTVAVLLLSMLYLPYFLQAQVNTAPKSFASPRPNELYRPNFHFTPPAHWMNDPNGLVFLDGTFHLFYQHYPEGVVWGPMHWGHATSSDMFHWEDQPIALYPDSLGMIFSGSAVYDEKNTSGLGKNGKGPLVALFTYHNMPLEKSGGENFQYQGLAYSNDQGKNWTKYAGNPVIPTPKGARDFRDPKVIWDARMQRWVVALAVKDHVEFWTAPDLIHWTYQSSFGANLGAHGGVWECPDLFTLPIQGSKKQKWVLLVSINPGGPNGGSATQYFVGDFDGKDFKLDAAFATQLQREKAVWLDWGRDNYAGVTFSNFTGAKGERLFLGWMSNWDYAQVVPTGSWRSAMTLPRSLSLKKLGTDWRLRGVPGPTLQMRDKQYLSMGPTSLETPVELNPRTSIRPDAMELVLEFELPADTTCKVGIELRNSLGERYRIGYDVGAQHFFSDRTQAGKNDFSKAFANKVSTGPRLVKDRILKMHLYFDAASCELFADNGLFQMTEIYFPTQNFQTIQVFSTGKTAVLRKLEAFGVKQ